MRILKFTANNFKRLRVVEIEPNGNVVVISGRNGQGKSSILDGIWAALGGRDGSKQLPDPVRHGEEDASVTLDMGKIVVTRTWKADGSTKLTVKSADGAAYGSPQSMIDNLIGKACFDPLAFTRADTKTQRELLLSLVDLPFDVNELAALRKGAFDERTDVNRDLKAAQARLDALTKPADSQSRVETGADEIVTQLHAARDRQRVNDDARGKLADAQTDLSTAQFRVQALQQQMDEAIAQVATAQKFVEEWQSEVAGIVDVDVSSFEAKLAALSDINSAARSAQQYDQVVAEVAGYSDASQKLTDRIDALDVRKADGLASAQMPVAGLGFDDDGVTFHGIPLAQCSAAEKLRIAIAIAIAMNPDVRVAHIADGSLLDTDSFRIITEMAEAHDFQVWIEVVDESGDMGVVIEDGSVRALAVA